VFATFLGNMPHAIPEQAMLFNIMYYYYVHNNKEKIIMVFHVSTALLYDGYHIFIFMHWQVSFLYKTCSIRQNSRFILLDTTLVS
jgi:hypothetical protein